MATITFKLPDDLAAELQRKADQHGFTSLHKCAQQVVVDYLNDTERHRLRKQMTDLHRDVIHVREDLATAVVVLLVQAGRINNLDEAKTWVDGNLMSS